MATQVTTQAVGDYTYTLYSDGTMSAKVTTVSTSKTYYGGLLTTYLYSGTIYTLTSLENCFEGCTAMTYAPHIPNTVTNMDYTFYKCSALIYAPMLPAELTTMNYAFSGCTSLLTPENYYVPCIPATVTSMKGAFDTCSSMQYGPTVRGEANNVFDGCTSLIRIQGVDESCTSLRYAFYNCSALTFVPDIHVSGSLDLYFVFYDCTSLTHAPAITAEGSLSNSQGAFYGCSGITDDIHITAAGFGSSSSANFYRAFYNASGINVYITNTSASSYTFSTLNNGTGTAYVYLANPNGGSITTTSSTGITYYTSWSMKVNIKSILTKLVQMIAGFVSISATDSYGRIPPSSYLYYGLCTCANSYGYPQYYVRRSIPAKSATTYTSTSTTVGTLNEYTITLSDGYALVIQTYTDLITTPGSGMGTALYVPSGTTNSYYTSYQQTYTVTFSSPANYWTPICWYATYHRAAGGTSVARFTMSDYDTGTLNIAHGLRSYSTHSSGNKLVDPVTIMVLYQTNYSAEYA